MAQEMKRLYQGFVVDVSESSFALTNRLMSTSSAEYETRVSISREAAS
jgi:beta-galactosidase